MIECSDEDSEYWILYKAFQIMSAEPRRMESPWETIRRAGGFPHIRRQHWLASSNEGYLVDQLVKVTLESHAGIWNSSSVKATFRLTAHKARRTGQGIQ